MRIVFFILSIFLSSIHVNAQSFLADDAAWIYTLHTFWEPDIEYNRHYISGDTIIQQKNCKVLFRETQTCDYRPSVDYIYEENQQIYYFNFESQSFKLLYDFSAEVGDVLTIDYWEAFGSQDSVFYIRIDSIGSVPFDALTLKVFYVTYDVDDDQTIDFNGYRSFSSSIIEHIGSSTNFFHLVESGFCDWKYNTKLRCYTHPDLGTLKFVDYDCTYELTANKEVNPLAMKAYPNPFEKKINLEGVHKVQKGRIMVHDLLGKMVFRKEIANWTAGEIDLSDLDVGMYLLSVLDADGNVIYADKVVKNVLGIN